MVPQNHNLHQIEPPPFLTPQKEISHTSPSNQASCPSKPTYSSAKAPEPSFHPAPSFPPSHRSQARPPSKSYPDPSEPCDYPSKPEGIHRRSFETCLEDRVFRRRWREKSGRGAWVWVCRWRGRVRRCLRPRGRIEKRWRGVLRWLPIRSLYNLPFYLPPLPKESAHISPKPYPSIFLRYPSSPPPDHQSPLPSAYPPPPSHTSQSSPSDSRSSRNR
mmetsp:Transcript_27155/g.57098  ORF Transcript_27155/g.57098 Transcript_27155/m.57098 type:complete len:217 (-) Transcript_27155:1119-1769(-)